MDEMNLIRVPRALDGIEPLSLDMSSIRQADARLQEVQFVNAQKAPELLYLFNRAWLDTSRYINLLEYEAGMATRRLEEIRAVFVIDKLPGLMVEKGLARPSSPLGSEDLRQDFLNREEDYKRMKDLMVILDSYIGLLSSMQKGFQNGFDTVKKILGSDTNHRPNPYLPQPQPASPGLPSDTFKVTSASDDDFFGVPK